MNSLTAKLNLAQSFIITSLVFVITFVVSILVKPTKLKTLLLSRYIEFVFFFFHLYHFSHINFPR